LGVNFKTTKQKDTYETAPNGNNVSIEEQMLKMSKNNTQHQEVTALAKKFNNLIAVAAGGN
jgi:flagellar basal-body rod protein FlgB